MLLRDHPLMAYRGVRNWPPFWKWLDGVEDKNPRGEIGTLKSVLLSKLQRANRCFLLIQHEGSSYLGCLLFDDPAFCKSITSITRVLQLCCNRSIAEIGGIECLVFFVIPDGQEMSGPSDSYQSHERDDRKACQLPACGNF